MNIYNLVILDESGSMCSIERQAINSLNETIQTVRAAQEKYPEQKQFITFISFSGSGMEGVKVLRDRVPAMEVSEISDKDYSPCGCTPLFDAMGYGITNLDKCVSSEDSVLVTIITDGEENSSRVYSGMAIAELVSSQRKKGWTFAYIGANQDAVEVAREMNIRNAMNFEASCVGTAKMSQKLNRSQAKFYDRIAGKIGSGKDFSDFFKDENDEKQ